MCAGNAFAQAPPASPAPGQTVVVVQPGYGQPPPGYGQHWEALRNIQMNYGDVLLSTEFLEMLERGTAATAGTTGQPAATQTAAY